MATLSLRIPENAPGRFYVDSNCSGCTLCGFLAPGLFKQVSGKGRFFLQVQPATPGGVRLVRDAMKYCPAGAIRDDGDSVHFWGVGL